jgi:hypothetical protein
MINIDFHPLSTCTIRALLVGAMLSAISAASFAEQADVASHMSCADYLKAEKASGWSQGITGSQSIDRLSSADASRIHDFCVANPQNNTAAAIEEVKQDPPQDAAKHVR